MGALCILILKRNICKQLSTITIKNKYLCLGVGSRPSHEVRAHISIHLTLYKVCVWECVNQIGKGHSTNK